MESLKEYVPGMDFIAKTFAGLENILTAELKALGAIDAEPIKRGAKFRGDLLTMYKANYLAGTAIRILKPISVFEVTDDNLLYDKVMLTDWTKVFNLEQTFSVEANVFHSELTHSHYVALKTKDAIVDQFRQKLGKRPWVDTENPDIFIDVHISHNLCTISLDSSGHSLHKRGYRVAADKAPINEVLANGMIRLAGWSGESDFYDPMCGSGTIAIEAAMIAMHIPAGYYRKRFAFMNWADFDEKTWLKVKEEADSHMGELNHRIIASDRSDKAVGFTRANLKSAGLHKDIEVHCRFFDSIKPDTKNGILMMNPPYGVRLEERGELKDLYRGIGDALKQNFTGFDAWIITPSIDTFKFIGLRPARRVPLYNGPIETRLLKFEVYQGSKRYGEENRDASNYSSHKEKRYTRRHEEGNDSGKRRFVEKVNRSRDGELNRSHDEKSGWKRNAPEKKNTQKGPRFSDKVNSGEAGRREEWEKSKENTGRRRIRSYVRKDNDGDSGRSGRNDKS